MNSVRKIPLALAGAALLVTLGNPAVAGKVYKWVDENGVTQYGERPPMGKEGSARVVSGVGKPEPSRRIAPPLPTGAPAAEAAKAQPAAGTPAADEKKKQDEEKKSLEEETAALQAKVREVNCRKAQDNLQVFSENARLRVTDKSGETRYLTDDEYEAKRAEAVKARDENCK